MTTARNAPVLGQFRTGLLAVTGLFAAMPAAAQAPSRVVRHAVTVEVAGLLAIRDRHVSRDTVGGVETIRWEGAAVGNVPYTLQVLLPEAGRHLARWEDGSWVVLPGGRWITVASGSPGQRSWRLEFRGDGTPAAAPEVRATPR